MVWLSVQATPPSVWELAARQHGVVARWQLVEMGFGRRAIEHRIAIGRLHPVMRGVYAVGRPRIGRRGDWMAAVLACGRSSLSHASAASLYGIRPDRSGRIDVTVVSRARPRANGVRVHRRPTLPTEDLARRDGIPVTSPIRTLLDLATVLSPAQLERAVNESDKLDLVDPETLRRALDEMPGERGVRALRVLLDHHTFRLTDSELERRFLRLVREAGLPTPQTQVDLLGFRVDFYWPELGLVVETDGLRYHRTPAQQARDRRRDQAHVAAGLTVLRFSHADVRYAPERVVEVLSATARGA